MIKKSVCFVLQLVDDFSGINTIGGGHCFTVDGVRAVPIRKTEGFYVFIGLSGEQFDVVIESARHSTLAIQVRPGDLNPVGPVLPVRLYRKPGLFFPDSEWLSGTYKPGFRAMALFEDTPPIRLQAVLSSDQNAPNLQFQGYTVKNVLGLRYCIGEGENREDFIFTQKWPDGSFSIDRTLRHPHQRSEPIRRAYSAVCDETGRFDIPVEIGRASGTKGIDLYSEEAMRWESLSISAP